MDTGPHLKITVSHEDQQHYGDFFLPIKSIIRKISFVATALDRKISDAFFCDFSLRGNSYYKTGPEA